MAWVMNEFKGGSDIPFDRRILLFEDEYLLIEEMQAELDQSGAVPLGPRPTVTAALRAVQDVEHGSALLNVQLCGELSFPVAAVLLANRTPSMFMSGNDEYARLRYPDIPCFPEPSDIPTLLQALRGLFKEHL